MVGLWGNGWWILVVLEKGLMRGMGLIGRGIYGEWAIK
jgi:hypothetical protein